MAEPIPYEDLYSDPKFAERMAMTKTFGIIRSTTALLSLLSSLILIWMLKRSTAGFSSIYHRMLLGMCIGDAVFSLSQAHFNAATPSDNDYFVWNAIGNQYTCSARGFLHYLGAITAMLYACSLNLYSLAAVKYQLSETYIRTKIEPFLHGVPLAWALIYSTTRLAMANFNDGGGGNCLTPAYNPPHCKGYEVGQVREGFEIPCGRGQDGSVRFSRYALYVSWFVVPFITLVSLLIIYQAVKQLERANSRYGAAAFASAANANARESAANEASVASRLSKRFRSTMSTFSSRQSTADRRSNSRLVLQRAFAFTMAFLLTWSFFIVGTVYAMAGERWPIPLRYLSAIFTPLQGFFNLCIFLHSKALGIKTRGGDDMTWCQALTKAIWTGQGQRSNASSSGGTLVRMNDQSKTKQTQGISSTDPDSSEAPQVEGPQGKGLESEAPQVDGPNQSASGSPPSFPTTCL